MYLHGFIYDKKNIINVIIPLRLVCFLLYVTFHLLHNGYYDNLEFTDKITCYDIFFLLLPIPIYIFQRLQHMCNVKLFLKHYLFSYLHNFQWNERKKIKSYIGNSFLAFFWILHLWLIGYYKLLAHTIDTQCLFSYA